MATALLTTTSRLIPSMFKRLPLRVKSPPQETYMVASPKTFMVAPPKTFNINLCFLFVVSGGQDRAMLSTFGYFFFSVVFLSFVTLVVLFAYQRLA